MTPSLVSPLVAWARREYRIAVVGRRSSRPTGVPDPDEVAQRVPASTAMLERLLVENVIPFWDERVIDDSGGYRLNHDATGRFLGPAAKGAIGQTRMVWYFARLARTRWGTPAHLEAARHGYRFLVDRLWDQTWGGFYWDASPTGTPRTRSKEALAQTYGLYGLTEYARATDDPDAATLASDLWRLFDRHYHDATHGGYAELRRQDWSATPGPGPLTADPGRKTLGVQLHVVEALTPFAEDAGVAVPDSVERLRELTLLLCLTMGNTPVRPGHARFAAHWGPVGDDRMRNYGHDVELLWMVEDAWRVLQLPSRWIRPFLTDVMDTALRFGFDHRLGGFLPRGLPGRPAHFSTKDYWAQAEGLLAALRLYHLTGDPRYGDCYLKTLEWIVNHQADWVHGDWHERVDRHGRPLGPKAGNWKEAHHHARALIECLELLEGARGRPTPVDADAPD